MVQIINQIFTSLKTSVEEIFPTIKVQKEYQQVASEFPTITFCEIENSEFSHTLDYTERKSRVSFQVDIYTIGGQRESQAKKIAKKINDVLETRWHMKREYSNQTINADQNIYRYTMRYSLKIDENSMRIYS